MKLRSVALVGVICIAALGLIGVGAHAAFTTSTTSGQTITAGTGWTTTTTDPTTTTTTTALTDPTDPPPPTVSVTYPVDGTTYGADWTGTITGTASPNSGPGATITGTRVAIEDTSTKLWWSGSSFSVGTQTFREDLYYRLNGFTLKMPPLRDRPEEIPILARHFMRKVAAKYEREPLPISPALMQALNSHLWPGNLRELENTIKRYLILADEQAIIDELTPKQGAESSAPDGEGNGGNGSLKRLVRNLKGGAESAAIARTLEGTGWNRKAAASDLQISYKALLYKIKQYNLIPPQKLHNPNLRNEG